MQLLLRIIVLFMYVFALLVFNIPGIEHDDFIKQKIYIFCGVFLFEFVVSLITTVYNKCIINLGKIAKNSFVSALLTIVAFSFYNDLVWSSNPWIAGQEEGHTQNLTITIIIIIFVSMGYFLDILFDGISPGMNDCINNIYPTK